MQGGAMKKWQCRAGGGCLVAHGFWGAHGENYPNKAVTLVVTAAPGRRDRYSCEGAWTTTGKDLGPTIIVENGPFANMSAYGPKRTYLVAPHMSALGGKANIAHVVF